MEHDLRVTYPLPRALLLTLIAGVIGLVTSPFEFPSFPFSLVHFVWKIGTVVVMVAAVRLFEHRRATLRDAGIVPVWPGLRRDRAGIALVGIVAMFALSLLWDQIPGLRSLDAAGSTSSYDAGQLTTGILVFELIGRYPFQVIAEESFFRGFLQPRLAVAAPVVGGILFALYHVQQWQTIPSLVPFGIALGLLRWWTGSIWPGVVFHYLGNAMFILSFE